jgi:glycosyltransferase involved in cell wall biosynthesis
MKIAIVEMTGKGGMIHYAFQLARALTGAGVAVTLVTDRHFELEALPREFEVAKVARLWDPKPAGESGGALVRKLRRVARSVRYYREWLRVVSWLSKNRFDVVQFGDLRFATDLLPLALLRRRDAVVADICHNVTPFTSGGAFSASRISGRLYRAIYRQFDVVFVHHERNRRLFVETFGVPAEATESIFHPNEEIFLDLRGAKSPGDLRRETGIPPDAQVVLFFGTLSRYKGVDLLLEAFAAIAAERPQAHLAVAGFPAADFDTAAHHRMVERLAISPRVHFFERYVDSADVAAWHELADVVVFPYREIYQSGAVQVAMTTGRAIVASRVGAFEDVIENEVNGLLVPPGDPAALSGAIGRLLDDAELRSRLAARAAADAADRFSWRRLADAILARYELEIASRKRGAR